MLPIDFWSGAAEEGGEKRGEEEKVAENSMVRETKVGGNPNNDAYIDFTGILNNPTLTFFFFKPVYDNFGRI